MPVESRNRGGRLRPRNLPPGAWEPETVAESREDTDRVTVDTPTDLLQKFGTRGGTAAEYVILDVKIKSVRNVMLERFALKVESVDDAEFFLNGTHVRLMFIGAFGAVSIVWNRVPEGESIAGKEMHPHCGGAFCFWLTIDAFATCACAWIGDVRRFDGVGRLDAANGTINPTFRPIFSVFGQMCCVYNLELFISMKTLSPTRLLGIVEDVRAFHKKYGGRTELRLDDVTLFLDLSLGAVYKFELYFKMLVKLGISRAAQHPGKFRMNSLEPIKEVSTSSALRPLVLQSV